MGANASGKTTLVMSIWRILLFLVKKDPNNIIQLCDKDKDCSKIEIDIAVDEEDKHELHRFKIMVNNLEEQNISVSHNYVTLSTAKSSKDSYETKKRELDEMEDNFCDYREIVNSANFNIGWNLMLPATEQDFNSISLAKCRNDIEEKEYIRILTYVFETLDNAIVGVKRSQDANNAIVIEHINKGAIIIQEGMPLSDILYLSSGTKYGINIANILFNIKFHHNGIYLIDEQFSYVNSDVEASLLATMVSLLGDNEQLFITTHNAELSSLGFPFHSFYFMKKKIVDGKPEIVVHCGSEAENRNNVSPKTIIDNDVFGTAPEVAKIFELGEGE